MEVLITPKEHCVREVEIKVPRADLVPEIEKSLKNAQKKMKLEGFRKGKVPLSVVKKLYGPHLEAEAIENLLPKLFQRAVQQESLALAAPGSIKNLDYVPGGDLTVYYEVEVEPEFELAKYENLKIDREIYETSSADVDEALEQIREEHSAWEKVEGKAGADHFLTVDLQELDASGVPLIGKKLENRTLNLKDEKGELTEVGQQLLEVETGDTRVITVTPPAEAGQENTPVKFEVKVNNIEVQTLPDLDDELAKDAGDYENLEALKAELEKRIKKNAQRELDKMFHHKIIEQLIKENKFDLPQGMIDFYISAIIKDIRARQPEDQKEEIDESKIREQYQDGAIFNLKWRLIRKKIAEMHDIKVEEKDVDEFIREYASDHGIDGDLLIKQMKKSPERLDDVRADILEQKILDFLAEKQKIKEKKISRKDLETKN